MKDDARTAALWLAFLADPVCAAGVLGVALGEGHLGGIAVPGAGAETVVFEAAAGGTETGEVVAEGLAARGGVFGLVGDLAFDADGLQTVDGGGGGGLGVAIWEELAGGFVAAVGTGADFGGGGAAGVERVGGSVGICWGRASGSGSEVSGRERRREGDSYEGAKRESYSEQHLGTSAWVELRQWEKEKRSNRYKSSAPEPEMSR